MTNEDKDLKLRECPFCGGEANEEGQHVFCSDCGAMPVIFDQTKDSLEEHRKLWNTRATPQQPSEPLKELYRDELLGSIAQAWCTENNKNKEMDATLAMYICDIIFKNFGQPSEKKALSRKEVYEWGYADGKKAQREVRYPIEYESDNDQGTLGDYEIGYNDAIDEMRKLNEG